MAMASVPATSWSVFFANCHKRSDSPQTRQTCGCRAASKNGMASGSPIPSKRTTTVARRQRVTLPPPSTGGCVVAHEWVGFPLVSNRGYRAVTGIDDRFERQGEQLSSDPFEKQAAVTVWKIGSADAAAEKHIAAEYERWRTWVDKDHVPRRMPRHIEYFQADAGVFD